MKLLSHENIFKYYRYYVIPGLFFILPCMDNYIKVDLRTITFDVPPQEVNSLILSNSRPHCMLIIPPDGSHKTSLGGGFKLFSFSTDCVPRSATLTIWLPQSLVLATLKTTRIVGVSSFISDLLLELRLCCWS